MLHSEEAKECDGSSNSIISPPTTVSSSFGQETKEDIQASEDDRSNDSSSVVSSQRRTRASNDKFRISTKQFALTYPQCGVLRATFDSSFKEHFRPAQFASAREVHSDGNYHMHVFVSFTRRVDVRSSRYFDLAFDGAIYHPNVQSCKDRTKWLTYISKGDDHGVDAILGNS